MLLAGVAFLACAAPGTAMAEDFQGWYLGLGVGYDGLSDMQATWAGPQPPGVANLGFNNAALGIASFGYKWGDFRGEAELGYAEHSLLKGIFAGAPDAGRFSVGSLLFNVDYDVPLGWGGLKWTVGAGVGIGNIQSTVNAGAPFGGDVIHGADSGFMWQVKSGFSLPVWDSLEGFVEYRYRQVDANSVESDFATIGPVHLESPSENVAMLGIRWYLEPPPPPPPPPPGGLRLTVEPFMSIDDDAWMLALPPVFSSKLAPVFTCAFFETFTSRSAHSKTIFFSAVITTSPSAASMKNFFDFTSKVIVRLPDLSPIRISSSPALSEKAI